MTAIPALANYPRSCCLTAWREAAYLVDVAAGHAQRGMVLADGLFVWPASRQRTLVLPLW
jgi:hypothetical protein